ncbi:MAG: hypothetical protein HY698_08025 [Deltaproteobacteria bacterium]|nr:hypothetical protein [Deltaproteobacteria bacterium]
MLIRSFRQKAPRSVLITCALSLVLACKAGGVEEDHDDHLPGTPDAHEHEHEHEHEHGRPDGALVVDASMPAVDAAVARADAETADARVTPPPPPPPSEPDAAPPPPPPPPPPPGTSRIYDETILAREQEYSDADLDRVRQAYLFFGHQSVGNNILAGLDSLNNTEPRYEVRQQYVYDLNNLLRPYNGRPALGHRNIGENEKPDTKIRAFIDYMTGFEDPTKTGLGDKVSISMFKFCYVDFISGMDVDGLFDRYVQAMESLEARYTKTKFVYATAPLAYGDANDVARNAFNRKVRDYVRSNGKRLFDVASIEATMEDGSRCTFTSGGETLERLCVPYMAGERNPHLNTLGGGRVGKAMMIMFADLLR